MATKKVSQSRNNSRSKALTPTKRFGLRFSLHRHSGHRLPWRHTSYAGLFFLLTLTGSSLLLASSAVTSGQGNINLNGVVNGPAPTTAAQILRPTDQTRVVTNILDVNGSCQDGLLIQIYRNGAFAGSAICTTDDTFSLQVVVLPGANELYARSSDSLNRYTPNSSTITVYYDKQVTPDQTQPLPLSIFTTPIQKGVASGQALSLGYEVEGGSVPYAVSIDWGDGSPADIVPLSNSGDFKASHTYQSGGQYVVLLSVTDNKGEKAVIQTIALINGELATGSLAQSSCSTGQLSCTVSNWLANLVDRIWPAFIVACLMTFSFWAGEKVIVYRNRRRPAGFANIR